VLVPVNFQGKNTSFGSPPSQSTRLETLSQIQTSLKIVRSCS